MAWWIVTFDGIGGGFEMSEDRIAEIYGRLNQTDVHISAMRTELDGIKGAVNAISSKLEAIAGKLSTQHSFEPVKVLAFISLLLAVMASIASFVIYMAGNVNASRMAVIEWRLDHPQQVSFSQAPAREFKQDRAQ